MTDEGSRLLVATGNKGKLRELRDLLGGVPVELVGLEDVGCVVEIEETGATFAENAALKASGYARLVGILTLADDSGLEIEALGGRPGVLSARYGGEDVGFDSKMAMLLEELERSGDKDRRARFVCSIAIADAKGEIVYSADGICSGRIASGPRGTNGFGYDQIFIPDGFEETFGELSDAVKSKISHRARAFCEIIPFLQGFLRSELDGSA
jgi:XTP/dITP diphosphohydrolase